VQRPTLILILVFGILAAPLATGAAQTPPDTTAKVKKPQSQLGKIVKKLADTAATAGAGAGVQSLLGMKAGGVANALGAAGVTPCGTGYGATAGSAIVGAAKNIIKKAADTGQTTSAAPCPQAGVIPGLPDAAAAAAAMAGANPLSGMGGVGAVAGMTPIGMAAAAAPGAVKGIKGMMGGKPQDKIAMLRELGRGQLEFKQVKFIEGTMEFEPGFEASFAAFAEAIALVEGTYYLYVAAESPRQKGEAPDTVLARKRLAKVWAAMAASGVSHQTVFAVSQLPPELSAGRKLPKSGDAKIEIIKFEKQP